MARKKKTIRIWACRTPIPVKNFLWWNIYSYLVQIWKFFQPFPQMKHLFLSHLPLAQVVFFSTFTQQLPQIISIVMFLIWPNKFHYFNSSGKIKCSQKVSMSISKITIISKLSCITFLYQSWTVRFFQTAKLRYHIFQNALFHSFPKMLNVFMKNNSIILLFLRNQRQEFMY